MADDAHPEWRSETRAVRAGRAYDEGSLAPVLWPSTTYFNQSVEQQHTLALSAHPAKFYSRNGSPSVLEFEDAVAALEGAEAALAFASGMGAISSVLLTFCSTGDHVVAQSSTFSVTNQLFTMLCPRLGIDVSFVDATDSDAVRAAVRPGKTQLVFVETPANPGLSVVDLDAIGAIQGPFTVCDSTFAPPPVQQTLSHGVDIVMHAATKGLAGHNDAMLGVIAGERDIIAAVWAHHLMHGAVCSPFDAWNALRGIRTLHVRVTQQSESALAMAEFLEGHGAVAACVVPRARLPSAARGGEAADDHGWVRAHVRAGRRPRSRADLRRARRTGAGGAVARWPGDPGRAPADDDRRHAHAR